MSGDRGAAEGVGLVEIRAIVRREMLDRVVHCLKESGIPRLTVTRVHAIGAGVDPAAARVAFEEGTEYSEKAMVQFICAGERCRMFCELLGRAAHTGRRGDGIVAIYPVLSVRQIHSGATGLARQRPGAAQRHRTGGDSRGHRYAASRPSPR